MIRHLTGLSLIAHLLAGNSAAGQDVPDQLDLPALVAVRATQASLYDLAQTGDRLVAVGEQGIVLSLDQPGDGWVQRPVPLSATLVAADFNIQGIGLVVGHDGAILRSPDRGETWVSVTDGRALFQEIIDAATIRFEAAEVAFKAAEETSSEDLEDLEFELEDESFRLETAQQSLQYGPSWPLLDVTFSAPMTAWTVGAYGMLFLTEDGGDSWTLVSDRIDNFEDLHLNAIMQTKSGSILIAGEAGLLFRSTDGGATFDRFDSDDGLSLFGLVETDDLIVAYGFGDSVQLSTDDGASWNSARLEDNYLLVGHLILGDGKIGLVGGGGSMITIGTDGPEGMSRPTGTRDYLSGGMRLASGETLFVSEAGITRFAKD